MTLDVPARLPKRNLALIGRDELLARFDRDSPARTEDINSTASTIIDGLSNMGDHLLKEFAQFPNPNEAWLIWKKHYKAGTREKMFDELGMIKEPDAFTMMGTMGDSVSIRAGDADPLLAQMSMLDAKSAILEHVESTLLGDTLPDCAPNPTPERLQGWMSAVIKSQEAASVAVRQAIAQQPEPLKIRECDVPDINFGVEIEGYFPSDAKWEEQKAFLRERFDKSGFINWQITQDGSIRTPMTPQIGNGVGVEIVSPILNGKSGFKEAQKMMDLLADAGFQTNSSCGIHTHVEVGRDLDDLKRLALEFQQHEDAFLEIIPKHRRNNPTCSSNREFTERRGDPATVIANCSTAQELAQATQQDKHHRLNLCACNIAKPPTAEYRMFPSAISPDALLPVLYAIDFTDKVLASERSGKPAQQYEIEKLREQDSVALAGRHCVSKTPSPAITKGSLTAA